MKTMQRAFMRKRASRNGGAIVTAMFVIMVMMIVAGSLHAFSSAMPKRVRLMTDAIRAKAIAEAGINRGYSMLRDNYAGSLSAFPISDNAFGGGQYTVRLVHMSDTQVRLISEGRFGTAEATVGVDARNAALTSADSRNIPRSPFANAIFANGTITINGRPKLLEGSMFTNNNFLLNGNYENVDGLIFARNADAIPAEFRGAWSEQPFPQLTDPEFAALIEDARARGVLYELEPDDRGDVIFHRDVDFTGVVLVKGNLVRNGAGTHLIDGMLYVTGNITLNGSGDVTVTGAILTGGNFTYNGASLTATNPLDDSSGPVEDETVEDHVVIDAWWD